MNDRERTIVRTGVIGIVANVLLAAFKAFVGVLSNSIAITLDAVNNLSDAMSSTITIIGTKLAGKKPDKKHPMGHGRIEYISAAVIAMIILYAGFTSLIDNEGEDNEVDHRKDIGAWYEMLNPGITPEWVKHQAQGFIDDLDWKEWCIMGVYETMPSHEVCGIIAFKNYQ